MALARPTDSEEIIAVREIHKNGWLICLTTADKHPRPFSKTPKPEKKWVVFCIHDDKEPFLELYENRRSAYSHKPQCLYSLLQCFHISPTIVIQEDDHVFAVSLDSVVIKLSAATNEEMVDWIETLTLKLRSLGILQLTDNVYSKEPTSPVRSNYGGTHAESFSSDDNDHLPSRDPNSPLPPVPVVFRNRQEAAFNFDLRSPTLQQHSHSNPNSPVLYEPLYLSGQSHSYDGSRRRSESEVVDNRREVLRSRDALSCTLPVSGSINAAAVEQCEVALILETNGASVHDTPLNIKALSLKETQAAALKREMAHKSGVRIVLRKRDCMSGVAFIECFGGVWIAGWKQRDHPLLHNTFHIGDKVLSVAGKDVKSVQDVTKEMKHQSLVVEFIILRVPYGKVFALKREYEGQDLGFEREGMTAEIKLVQPTGLSAKNGLPAQSSSPSGYNLCNWMLTEVNNRPLNLFFKDNEVQERLNAVGLDISILVQPVDLVMEIRKQLKSVRSYKDFVVQ